MRSNPTGYTFGEGYRYAYAKSATDLLLEIKLFIIIFAHPIIQITLTQKSVC